MTIDIHAHIVPDGFIAALASEVPAACPALTERADGWYFEYPGGRISGPVPAGMFDVSARLEDMNRAAVDVQALSVPPTHFQYRLEPGAAAVHAGLYNDAVVDIARAHPNRFVVLGTLPMQDVGLALAELERLAALPEVVGLELGTNVAGTNLGHERLRDVWGAVAAAGLAVVLHPSEVAGHDRMSDHYLHNFVGNPADSTLAAGSLIFGGVLERNAALRIALLHGGGFLPYQIGRFDHGWRVRPEARTHIDRAPSEFLDRFFFDTLTHDRAALEFLLARVGADRLALGSDYPFDMADPDPVASVRAAAGDPDTVEKVLDATPRSLLTRAIAPAQVTGR
jgi:aminocarboxymuconate-semialdehyde decarboxylase